MSTTKYCRGLIFATLITLSPVAHSDWTAKRVYDPVKNESYCVVESNKQSLHDGYQDTTVFLRVDQQALLIMTKSNIDPDEPEAGIRIDNHDFIRLEKVYREQNALFEKHNNEIIEHFKKGLQVIVSLKFWPTWPGKGIRSTTFSLVGFRRAFAQLPDCS